ncbi:MAG: asparagine synthase-related protein [Verrucomicrobiota bacterium]|jgi:asparagine synthetase B (glutamine-hydrolysing)
MSDFLIQLGPSADPQALLALLQQPYGANAPRGIVRQYPWGASAVLEEKIGRRANVVSRSGWLFAWVGELVAPAGLTGMDGMLNALTLRGRSSSPSEVLESLKGCGLLEALNGAFAVMLCSDTTMVVITDPMASVQVYAGRDGAGRLSVVGTHPDLVATLCGPEFAIDPVSVCDFLNVGIPCCPHTMHRAVKEVWPGTVCLSLLPQGRPPAHAEFRYWLPPSEMREASEAPALIDEFVDRWQRAVRLRCQGDRLAIQLSGGMDSRLVLASIPYSKECVAVTLCDSMNREARLARKIANCYEREWVPLKRDPEYLGRTLIDATRFTGCEGEYHHGHTIGFARQLQEMGVDSVFTGLLMDNNFKGYYAKDVVRVPRLKGLLPARYATVPLDYVNQVSDFCRRHLRDECVGGTLERRRRFQEHHFALQRESRWEWLDGYPYSQACDNTAWVIERRVMPLRLPVMDRGLLDLAFRVPARLKAGGYFFEQAALRILGQGRKVPNANDGVRPGSGHLSRLIQRAVRKTQRQARSTLSRLGFRLPVPHSWHDFPRYLRESSALTELIAQNGKRLTEFEGTVFRGDPIRLLRNPEVPWVVGYRLIQLAVWRSLLDQYALQRRKTAHVARI